MQCVHSRCVNFHRKISGGSIALIAFPRKGSSRYNTFCQLSRQRSSATRRNRARITKHLLSERDRSMTYAKGVLQFPFPGTVLYRKQAAFTTGQPQYKFRLPCQTRREKVLESRACKTGCLRTPWKRNGEKSASRVSCAPRMLAFSLFLISACFDLYTLLRCEFRLKVRSRVIYTFA